MVRAKQKNRKARVFVKGTDCVTTECVIATVKDIHLSGAYGRCTAWENDGVFKDLDWLFRPMGYTNTYCRRIMAADGTKVYQKGKDRVTIQCVMDIVGITRPAAHTRCDKWLETSMDLDWLFRPVGICKNTKKHAKAVKPPPSATPVVPPGEDYRSLLRKHWGIVG